MECGDMDTDWVIHENSIGKSLLEIRRMSLINYLKESITPFTYEEILRNEEGKFLKEYGGIDELRKMYDRRLAESSQGDFLKSFEKYKEFCFRDYLGLTFFLKYSKYDEYDYTSQKYAIDILARFNQYRQVAFIPEGEDESNMCPDIEVNFIDEKNVGRFQVYFEMLDKNLTPDILNTNPIKQIKKCDKVPILPLDELKHHLPLKNPLEFYPNRKNMNNTIYHTPFYDKFRDSRGNEKEIVLSDCMYILMDRDSQPYRRLPILDIIKPHLKKKNFSRGKWPLLTDYYGSEWNTLLHSYNQENKEIQFRLCACDQSSSSYYNYTVFDIKIKLTKELEVEVCENKNENFSVIARHTGDFDY